MALQNYEISENGYWITPDERGHCFDTDLAEQLKNFFQNKTVLDLGCGPGRYVKLFLDNKISCNGFDGNPNTKKISNGICNVADLSKKQNFEKVDWVLSLEVGEHIPKKYEDIFIDNIVRHANNGIVLSWGIPGQAGDGHVNCQPNEYIISKIKNFNFEYNKAKSEELRKIANWWWYKNTIMVFDKKI